jgi:hypothetical protein
MIVTTGGWLVTSRVPRSNWAEPRTVSAAIISTRRDTVGDNPADQQEHDEADRISCEYVADIGGRMSKAKYGEGKGYRRKGVA